MMNPAPGYDALIPHDMMHLVVEAQLGLKRGIFGQLAAGAGTFQLAVKDGESSREVARTRRRLATRGKKSMKAGRDECLQSERATYICMQEWLARSTSRDKTSVRSTATIDQKKMDDICEHLDQLSACWSSLEVGESMSVSWPDLATDKRG